MEVCKTLYCTILYCNVVYMLNSISVLFLISNDKLLKLITELTNNIDNLSNIVNYVITYQTNLIQELKTDKLK